jgi:hypothetical protein
MAHHVQCFPYKVKVQTVVEVLKQTKHNGFPVVDPGRNMKEKTLVGLILRRELKYLIKDKAWKRTEVSSFLSCFCFRSFLVSISSFIVSSPFRFVSLSAFQCGRIPRSLG